MYNIQAVNYLDDFIVIGATLEEATLAQKVVIKVLRYLGFYISWGKVTPPSQVCSYLGLDIDSIKMEIRLPTDKLEKLINLLKKYVGKSTISKKELESLGVFWLIAPVWWIGVELIQGDFMIRMR